MEETHTHNQLLEEEDYSNVTLLLYSISDVDIFMAWAADENACKFLSWEPDTFASKETAMDYFLQDVIPDPWYKAIMINTRAIREIVVTRNRRDDNCRAEIGFSIGSKYWGKGIMTRALKMVASIIFSDWPTLGRLEAIVYVEDRASQRVLEKVGFQRGVIMRRYYLHKGKPVDAVISVFSLVTLLLFLLCLAKEFCND